MNQKTVIPVLAAGHGINDGLAGYFLGCLAAEGQDLARAGMALLVYNLLAFGGQLPVAFWLEKIRDRKKVLMGAFALNLLAALLFPLTPSLTVVLTGIASAVYHVAGGSVCAGQGKAAPVGLFAAPGVAGLIAGGYLSWTGQSLLVVMPMLAGFFLLLLSRLDIPQGNIESAPVSGHSALPDRHDLLMILLLTVISLRSAVWNIYQLLHEGQYSWLIPVAAAAFAGKVLGGWISDRIGWRLYTHISLLAAAPLLSFFKEELILFCIGIGLLQSGIPATTLLLVRHTGGKTERAIGISFGLAIVIGAFAFAIPPAVYQDNPFVPLAGILVTALLFYCTGYKKARN